LFQRARHAGVPGRKAELLARAMVRIALRLPLNVSAARSGR